MSNAALDSLIYRFKTASAASAAPDAPATVNPSAASRILETETRPEVERTAAPAPEAVPVQEPAASAADAPKASRRTAAVVQSELDLALKELATASAQIAALKSAPAARSTEAMSLEVLISELKRRGLGVYSIP